MNLNNQIELELYFADHFDTILFPVLAEMYLEQNDLRRARKVCDIGLKHHSNDSAGLFVLAQVERSEGNLKEAEKILEQLSLHDRSHFAAIEMLCEIQTVLGRAQNRLLRSWKHVLRLDPNHKTAKDFVKKVSGKDEDKPSKTYTKTPSPVKPKPEISKDLVKESPTPIAPVSEVSDPLKVSSRLATFTLVSVLKNQGLFSQALEVLDVLEEKGESLESISLERETIQTLIDRSNKD